ncbi:MAG: hypothetical protein HZB41_11225 [Ignavibacteriae bacterium]|nr:hypothetical protein [Ignavibacteriota bacterium]
MLRYLFRVAAVPLGQESLINTDAEGTSTYALYSFTSPKYLKQATKHQRCPMHRQMPK